MKSIEEQCLELRRKYQYLYLVTRAKKQYIIGSIFIDDQGSKDSYEIEICIPKNFPRQIPLVTEVGSKIPQTYHRNADSLCLEIPLTEWEIYHKDKTLLNYVDNLVFPYLVAYGRFARGDGEPAQHAHGVRGKIDDYSKRFNTNNLVIVLDLLRFLFPRNYREDRLCPCGSQLRLCECHGAILSTLNSTGYNFQADYKEIRSYIENALFLKEEYRSAFLLRPKR